MSIFKGGGIMMIDKIFDKIEDQYHKLNGQDKKVYEETIRLFTELLSDENIIKDLKKYFILKKKKEIKKKLAEFSTTDIRNILMHSSVIKPQYYDIIYAFTWKLLPMISSFKSFQEFNNFLAYVLNVDINISVSRGDKKKLVGLYKKKFDSFEDNEKKQKILHELARRVFVEATKEELNKAITKR